MRSYAGLCSHPLPHTLVALQHYKLLHLLFHIIKRGYEEMARSGGLSPIQNAALSTLSECMRKACSVAGSELTRRRPMVEYCTAQKGRWQGGLK